MDMPTLANQQELTYNCSVRIQDAVWKTCWVRWLIGMDGEREREKTMLAVWLDDIYTYIYIYKISKVDKLGMILFENILEDSYKSPGVLNVW